jgi:hypothetical protein
MALGIQGNALADFLFPMKDKKSGWEFQECSLAIPEFGRKYVDCSQHSGKRSCRFPVSDEKQEIRLRIPGMLVSNPRIWKEIRKCSRHSGKRSCRFPVSDEKLEIRLGIPGMLVNNPRIW